jgi:hypothetical protein
MTSQSIKPNKSTIWFDKFVEEHKEEFLAYKQNYANKLSKKEN